jgi:hypothetical protein
MSKSELAKKEVRALPCKLTDEELLARGDSIASIVQDIAAEKERQKSQKAEMKARLEELEARKARLASVVKRREEDRDIPCEIWFLYDELMVETRRTDSDLVVDRRRMTNDEMQMSLPDPQQERPRHDPR